MKTPGISVVSFFAGALLALVVTTVAWDLQIEGRAYECKDSNGPFATFQTNMSSHRDAGDRLIGDWTWERIEQIGTMYRCVFYALWFACAGGIFVALRKRRSLTRR